MKTRALCHGDVFNLGRRIFLRFVLTKDAEATPARPAPRLMPARAPAGRPAAPAKPAEKAPAAKAPPPADTGAPEDVGICTLCGEVVPGGETIHADCREISALIGKELSGVKVVERIGGVRPVHRLRAHQPTLEAPRPSERLPAGQPRGEEFRARLLEEVRSISRLLHPRILQIHDLVDEKSVCFVVMEFFEGRALREVLKKQAFVKVPAAIQIMHHLAEGLAYAETQDMVLDRLDPARRVGERLQRS